MKTSLSRQALAALIAIGSVSVFLASTARPSAALSNGPPAYFTDAPGEGNCTTCHTTYGLNTGTATFSVWAPTTVVPGSTNTITVGFGGSTSPRHGFEITARDGAGNPAGSWQVIQPGITQDSFASTFHHEHTLAGVSQSNWQMAWVAPGTLSPGPVTFYAAGNQANQNFLPDGDYIYTARAQMFQASLSSATTTWPNGTVQTLSLSAPTHPGELYLIAVSESTQTVNFGGSFDLQCDINTGLTYVALQNPQVFANIFSVLNAAGQATATISIPSYAPLAGLTIHFAAITADASFTATEVSNRLSVTFQ